MPSRVRNLYRLSPGPIAQQLFCLAPDRDERAPYLCAETLLTLVQNGYDAPADVDDLRSPKRQLFAVRSLALGVNFLGGRRDERAADSDTTPEDYGALLARGSDLRGSANLALAQQALQGLVDPETERGEQAGSKLLRPFHESLLWFDARKASPNSSQYTVRKVHMRGTGITLARMLVDPPDPDSARLGRAAVQAIRAALTGDHAPGGDKPRARAGAAARPDLQRQTHSRGGRRERGMEAGREPPTGRPCQPAVPAR